MKLLLHYALIFIQTYTVSLSCFLFANKAWAADVQPFTYLNQYYIYKAIDNNSFRVNNRVYSLDNLLITITNTGTEITIKDVSFYRSSTMQLEVLDQKGAAIQTVDILPTEKEYRHILDLNLPESNFVCLVARNEFTTKKLCTKIQPTQQSSENTPADSLKFSANGTMLNLSGRIVLSSKNNNLIFRAKNSNSFFELITSNKKVIPNRVYKIKGSDSLQAEFVELDQPNKYNFKRKIKLSDTNFKIAIDNLITVYQDITFLNKNLINESVDYEFKNWKARKYNKIGVEPIILFSLLAVDSEQLKVKVISDLSKGIRVYFTRYPTNNLEYYYAGRLILLQQRNDVNQTQINNIALTLIGLEGGIRFYQTPNFYYDLNASLQELVYAEYQAETTAINLVKALTPKVDLIANSTLYEISQLRFHVLGGLGLVGPSSIPSGQTQLAFELVLGTQVSYKIRGGRFYYGFDYSFYNANNSTYKYAYHSLEHKMGFYYLY